MAEMSKADRVKIVIAVAALAIGGALIAWNYGAFDGLRSPAPAPTLTDSQMKEAQRQQEQAKKQEAIAPPSGS